MGPRRVLVGGQDPDLPPGHLLFMDVHRLKETRDTQGSAGGALVMTQLVRLVLNRRTCPSIHNNVKLVCRTDVT